MPSETESFGLAALEAMAEGVPVVSSNTGGIPEVNVHGYSGFLSDVGNVDEMAQNSIRILKNDSDLIQFRRNAHERSKTFSLGSVLPTYEQLYEQVLDKMKQ